MLVTQTLLFLAFVVGTILHLFLAVLLVRKRQAGAVERLLLAAVVSGGLWHAGSALSFFHRINAGVDSSPLLSFFDQTAQAGLALTPAFLLHLCLVWMKVNPWLSLLGYVTAPLSWRLLGNQRLVEFHWVLAPSLVLTAVACLLARRRTREPLERRFLGWLAATLLFPALALLSGDRPALAAWSALAPPLCFAYFVYRYDFLGLFISRRIIFALNLGVFAAFYLLLVRRIADFVEDEFLLFGDLTELALIFGAALVWIPLYAWMNRFLSKRGQLAADFSKRLIEEAARILDFRQRLQFLVDEVGRTFQLRRAFLVAFGEPAQQAAFGAPVDEIKENDVATLRELAVSKHLDIAHTQTTASSPVRAILEPTGFNYLFPLWYEDHLSGLLLLDTRPRVFLDEDEPVVVSLCRQISHSIETSRIVEEKIGLERTLLDQQHLARMGQAAAAIAHEVKNPLSSIKTLAQLMQEDADVRERYARDLTYMVGEVDRLNSSVQQLLSFARPKRTTENDVNLTSLLETTAYTLARQQNQDGIRIDCRSAPELELKHSNPELLEQVVLNLMLNAIQASDAGGTVTVAAEKQPGSKVAFHVEDEGPGIPGELRDQIFEPFYTTKQKGTGLGLAIVKKNVEELRGAIEIESPVRKRRGTRVTVTLPAE